MTEGTLILIIESYLISVLFLAIFIQLRRWGTKKGKTTPWYSLFWLFLAISWNLDIIKNIFGLQGVIHNFYFLDYLFAATAWGFYMYTPTYFYTHDDYMSQAATTLFLLLGIAFFAVFFFSSPPVSMTNWGMSIMTNTTTSQIITLSLVAPLIVSILMISKAKAFSREEKRRVQLVNIAVIIYAIQGFMQVIFFVGALILFIRILAVISALLSYIAYFYKIE